MYTGTTLQNILLDRLGHEGGAASVVLILLMLFCIAVPYLLGSVNFALVISKVFYHDDIRKYGSGNAGMTNMLRTYGKSAAAATLLCDMLKSVVSVLFGSFLLGTAFGGYLAGMFCVIGHIFPIFFKFKGGKGVATVAAMILTLDPLCFLILAVIFLLLVAATRYVSLGSVICMMLPHRHLQTGDARFHRFSGAVQLHCGGADHLHAPRQYRAAAESYREQDLLLKEEGESKRRYGR